MARTTSVHERWRLGVSCVLGGLWTFNVGVSTMNLVAIGLLSLLVEEYKGSHHNDTTTNTTTTIYNGDGAYNMFVLACLTSVVILLNWLGCYVSYALMHSENRARMEVTLLKMLLIQGGHVVVFCYYVHGCYSTHYLSHVEESLKVSSWVMTLFYGATLCIVRSYSS